MPPEALRHVRRALHALSAGLSGSGLEGETASIQLLCGKLEAGSVAEEVQAQVMRVADAISRRDYAEARRVCAAGVAAQRWEHHKDWIVPLRRLLAPC